jgi:energy-coupling factor transporter transmembrane protein EcfT
MPARSDYSCEIIALMALTALSALSHFWYIMIAIFLAICVAVTVHLVSRVLLQAKTEMLVHLAQVNHRNLHSQQDASVDMGPAARTSLPAA